MRTLSISISDKLVTRDFGTGTRGFAAADELQLAVCVMPGTKLAFARDVACLPSGLLGSHYNQAMGRVRWMKAAGAFNGLPPLQFQNWNRINASRDPRHRAILA